MLRLFKNKNLICEGEIEKNENRKERKRDGEERGKVEEREEAGEKKG